MRKCKAFTKLLLLLLFRVFFFFLLGNTGPMGWRVIGPHNSCLNWAYQVYVFLFLLKYILL